MRSVNINRSLQVNERMMNQLYMWKDVNSKMAWAWLMSYVLLSMFLTRSKPSYCDQWRATQIKSLKQRPWISNSEFKIIGSLKMSTGPNSNKWRPSWGKFCQMKLMNAFQYYYESWVDLRKSYFRTLIDQS